MTTTTVTAWLADTPSGLGTVAGRGSRVVLSRAKRRRQVEIGTPRMADRLQRGLANVQTAAVLRFPTTRCRGGGSFRAPVEKALGDALGSGGWLSDAMPWNFRLGAINVETGEKRTMPTPRGDVPAAPPVGTGHNGALHGARVRHGGRR